jgi:hypothetical protein
MGGYSRKKTNVSDCLAACLLESAEVPGALGTLGASAMISPSYLLSDVVLKNVDRGLQNCGFDASIILSPF